MKQKLIVTAALTFMALPAAAQKPIVIGEISSYSTVPAFTVPYRNGWQLAVEEINAAGGLLDGRKIEAEHSQRIILFQEPDATNQGRNDLRL